MKISKEMNEVIFRNNLLATLNEFDYSATPKFKITPVYDPNRLPCGDDDYFRLVILGEDNIGGKILSLASKIPEVIMNSDLSVKSIKASDLFYEKKLDRLCYNFSLKLTYTVGNITDKISIGETVISVSSFSFSRKQAISETKTLSAGVRVTASGGHPLLLSVKGVTKLSAKSFSELDNAVKTLLEIPINIGGAYLPSMSLTSYRLRGGRTATIEAEFIEIKKGDENE